MIFRLYLIIFIIFLYAEKPYEYLVYNEDEADEVWESV